MRGRSLDWLHRGGQHAPPPFDIQPFDAGTVEGVPLGITDATALERGGWLFSAVAEDIDNAVDDGQCRGSVIGEVAADGGIVRIEALAGHPKVEGVARDGDALWLVTDADDPARPSGLYRLQWD